MKSKYEAVLTCGYCGKKSKVSDKTCENIVNEKQSLHTACSCGHVSYASSMRCKMLVDTKRWRFSYGTSN